MKLLDLKNQRLDVIQAYVHYYHCFCEVDIADSNTILCTDL